MGRKPNSGASDDAARVKAQRHDQDGAVAAGDQVEAAPKANPAEEIEITIDMPEERHPAEEIGITIDTPEERPDPSSDANAGAARTEGQRDDQNVVAAAGGQAQVTPKPNPAADIIITIDMPDEVRGASGSKSAGAQGDLSTGDGPRPSERPVGGGQADEARQGGGVDERGDAARPGQA